ncbi:NAD(P)-binding protein [Imleria badia]|nr:NAD(P)-binding protein [Imleria badia]
MSTKTQIFIIGATGYIGGTVLKHLLQHRTAPASEITALVRNAEKIPLFASISVKTVLGALDDGALLERQASESDVVFACADSDHVGACEAILRGLKKRHEVTDTVPILVHTSGTDVLFDNACGMYGSDIIWDDADLDQLEKIPNIDPHRLTDPLVIAADREGYARTHIVLPDTIYDFATGRLVDLGIRNPRSVEIPKSVEVSITRKRAGMVGLGLNIWSNVHIDDLGDLYIVLYDAILDGCAGHGCEGLYFAENGEDTIRAISERIGEALVEFGMCSPDERTPTSFDETDYTRPENERLHRPEYSSNSRCKASRARALGWQPKHVNEDMLKSVRGEVEWQLKHKASA